MTSYLLDTNIISDLIKNPDGVIMRRIAEIGEDNIATNIIVASELRFGAEKKGSDALRDRVDLILSRMNVLDVGSDADRHYGIIRADLETKGTPIGGNDLLIAAHVVSLAQADEWVLVTANVREFQRVDGLTVENWL
ncbi:type II toxin-antitoxin system VapC family toxin [Nitratireductor sp. XY-223]|uniref:type II toxin-antitoxin system VapC family toxin n=1 Tax=Hyphomicrobiales TaxID=356 RepID=UPI0010AB06F5|nr:type II toxin-antitoxin system VapC family toxin [Nitratireductor sp. XY-223]